MGVHHLNLMKKLLLPYGFPIGSTSNDFISIYWPNGKEKEITANPYIRTGYIKIIQY